MDALRDGVDILYGLNYGNALTDARRYEEAVQQYRIALDLSPDSANGHFYDVRSVPATIAWEDANAAAIAAGSSLKVVAARMSPC